MIEQESMDSDYFTVLILMAAKRSGIDADKVINDLRSWDCGAPCKENTSFTCECGYNGPMSKFCPNCGKHIKE